jgi:hypothetical protein
MSSNNISSIRFSIWSISKVDGKRDIAYLSIKFCPFATNQNSIPWGQNLSHINFGTLKYDNSWLHFLFSSTFIFSLFLNFLFFKKWKKKSSNLRMISFPLSFESSIFVPSSVVNWNLKRLHCRCVRVHRRLFLPLIVTVVRSV